MRCVTLSNNTAHVNAETWRKYFEINPSMRNMSQTRILKIGSGFKSRGQGLRKNIYKYADGVINIPVIYNYIKQDIVSDIARR